MHIALETQPLASLATPALVTYVFEKDGRIEGSLAELDKAAGGRLKQLADSGELTGKTLEMTLLHYPAGLAAERLLLIGAGKPDKFTPGELRKLAAAALRYLKARSVKKLTFAVRESDCTAAAAQAVTEGLLLGSFDSDRYKTEKKNGAVVDSASLAGFDVGTQAAAASGI